MRRRDFLKALGIGAFACAVHNVPKVTAKTASFQFENPGTLRLGMDGEVIYEGPHKVVPSGRRLDISGCTITFQDGLGKSVDVQIGKGEMTYKELTEQYFDRTMLAEVWAQERMRLAQSAEFATFEMKKFGDAWHATNRVRVGY